MKEPNTNRYRKYNPLTLYVHFPWCIKKCPYCDFNSHQLTSKGVPEADYVSALMQDLKKSQELINGRTVEHIFLGGGTPSLFSADAILKIFDFIFSLVKVDARAEITMEVNPGSLDINKVKEFRNAGVNRLSIGVQSFNNRHLRTLGRTHSAENAQLAVETAKKYFDNINVDLMYALPGQTKKELNSDLRKIIQADINHVSIYQLTVEPHTYFWKNRPNLPNDELALQMEEIIMDVINKEGFKQYEISGFAKENFESRHNINYWKFGDYLGLGAGAHSKISDYNGTVRIEKPKSPKLYMVDVFNQNTNEKKIIVSKDDLPAEFMMNALRLKDGFQLCLFRQRTGLEVNLIQDTINRAVEKGLLELTEDKVKPTRRGFLFLNNLIEMFIS